MKPVLIAFVFASTCLSLATGAEDGHAVDDQLAFEAEMLAPAAPPAAPAAATASARFSAGEWGAVINWTPHIPVTAANLPDGRLLTFASNKRTTFPVGAEFTYAAVWDPKTGAFTEINNGRHDMFCGGTSMLPDGRVVVNGGRNTVRLASAFDWRSDTWTVLPNMNDPRWYNTSVALPNGGVFTVSGDGGSNTAERWDAGGVWNRLSGIPWQNVISQPGYLTRWHPLVVVAPDGRLFHGGPTRQMNWLTTEGSGSLAYSGVNVPGALYPKEGCFAMYDEGRILVAGGSTSTTPNPNDTSSGTSSTAAFTIDIRSATPVVAGTQSMKYPRQFANSVILPNGEVMIIGGNTSGLKFSDTGSVLTPEVWNPQSGQWRDLAQHSVPRNYHSVALLLADGRVWSGGGGLSGGSADHRDAQVFTPPQLFTATGSLAARPQITQAPSVIGTGSVFEVTASAGVSRFTFVKMSSQTHSVNTDLRFLELPFTAGSSGSCLVRAHSNLNVMTPGYWMLFALDANGVWSESRIVQVSLTPGVSVQPPAIRYSVVNQPVSVQIAAAGAPGAVLNYSASGEPAGLSIHTATGVISGVPTALGTHACRVTATDGVTSSTVAFDWTIHLPLEVAALTTSPLQSGALAQFSASVSGGANPRFRWHFGDGTPLTEFSSQADISHRFMQPGHYTVTVTVIDDSGAERSQSFTQIVHAPLAPQAPAVSSSLLFESRAGSAGRVWVVNPDSGTVCALAADTLARLAEIPTGANPRALALAPDGLLWVVNSDSATIAILDTTALSMNATLTLPRGSRPFGLAFDPNSSAAFVALEGSGQVLKLHPVSGAVIAVAEVGANVRHVSVSSDGARVYVSRFITPPVPGENTATPNLDGRGGEVVVLDAASLGVERTILLAPSTAADTPTSARGLPNYLGAVTLSPDGLTAWVPSKQDNIQRGVLRDGFALTHDQTVRAIASRIDLAAQAEDHAARIDFDDAGMPSAAAFDRWGGVLYVALESTRAVAVVDPYSNEEVARIDTGRAPQGVVVSPDGRRLFVQNYMDRSVSAFDVSPLVRGESLPPLPLATAASTALEPLSLQVLRGKQFFHDAFDGRLALQRYISCAACHNEGGHDGRTWDLTGFGEGLRNTITLRGHANHGPLHWSGNFDEVQDFEGQIRALSRGTGLMSDADFHSGTRSQPMGDAKAGVSADLDALAAYVKSLSFEPPSPHRAADGSLTPAAQAGEQVFRRMQCASCHGGEAFTRSALGLFADIGTQTAASGQRLGGALSGFDIPTLRGVWATAPYLHDGSAATLADAVRAHRDISLGETELSQLSAYLAQIDGQPAAAPEPQQPVLSGQNVGAIAVAGSHAVGDAGAHTLRGAGAGLGETGDSFYGMLTRLHGDGEIRARLTSLNGGPQAVAGLMLRESLTGPARQVSLFVAGPDSGGQIGVAWRAQAGGAASFAAGPPANPAPNNWLRLTRAGDTVSAFISSDGVTWSLLRSVTLANLPRTLFAGLCAASGSPHVLGTAVLDQVRVSGGQFPLPEHQVAVVETLPPGSADLNRNGIHDLIDHAFGDGTRPEAGWSLQADATGVVTAVLRVPEAVTDLSFALESSGNLTAWTPLTAAPVVTTETGGLRRIEWRGIESLPGLSAQRGLVRLRVSQNGGASVAGAPQGWQRHTLAPGLQAMGVNLIAAPLHASQVRGLLDGGAAILPASAVTAPAPNQRCYLEVQDGPHAGHRLELAVIEPWRLTPDLNAPLSTLRQLPADLTGSIIQIRPHLTLAQVFEPSRFQGGTSAARADQVCFFTASGWQTHWLFQSGATRRWVRAGDASLLDAGAALVPPGTGVMVKIQSTALAFTHCGHVRTSAFRRPLQTGANFLASPWPLNGTPNGWQINAANGFTAGANPAASDQVQIWNGAAYDSYWLLRQGGGSILTPLGSAALTDVGDTLPLPAGGAFFLRVQPATAAQGWNILPPVAAP